MLSKGSKTTFSIDYQAEDGKQLQGVFSVKRLSILDQARVSRRKSELCGGMYCVRDENGKPTGQGIDAFTEYANDMIATLEVAIVTAPEWWVLDEVYEEDLIIEVYKEVSKFQDSFRRPRRKEDSSAGRAGSSETDSEKEHTQANSADDAPKVVGKEVQASLDA